MRGPKTGLVIKRKIGQSVVMETSDGSVRITLTQRTGNYVKMLFELPEEIDVFREEILIKEGPVEDDDQEGSGAW